MLPPLSSWFVIFSYKSGYVAILMLSDVKGRSGGSSLHYYSQQQKYQELIRKTGIIQYHAIIYVIKCQKHDLSQRKNFVRIS